MRTGRLATLSLILTFRIALGGEFFIDPVGGSNDGDGSRQHPWQNLQEVINEKVSSQTWDRLPYRKATKLIAKNPDGIIKGGDTIWLANGNYGDLRVTALYNQKPITIAAAQGTTPKFHSVIVRSSANWVLRGLSISPEYGAGKKPRTLLLIMCHGWTGPSHDITAEGCRIFSAADSSGWTKDDWLQKMCNGIQAYGEHITIRNCHLKNVNFGITVGATHSRIENNSIINFAGDGLRGLGDYTLFASNTIENCYAVNDNHDDGFQSWSKGDDGKVGSGVVRGIVLRGNRIINFTDPNQPFRGHLQGIGCFGGFYRDWVIENNLIVVDQWHGITLMGAENCKIINNTVTDASTGRPGPPWIRIDSHKDGRASSNCVVRNNLTSGLHVTKGSSMQVDHNIIIRNPADYFVNPAGGDFRLRPQCKAIDAGITTDAPTTDIVGTPRPRGKQVDIGAYEARY